MDRKILKSGKRFRRGTQERKSTTTRCDATRRDAPNDLIAWAMNVLARVVRVTPAKDPSTFESSFFALATPSVLERAQCTQ